MFVVGLVGVIAAATIPQALASRERARARAAVRFVCARMAIARAQAVSRGSIVALRFDSTAGGITFTPFIDGNRNGVLTRDIGAGVDRQLEAPVRLSDLFPRATLALTIPGAGTNPVQLSGGSNLLSFTAIGTATAGSIYVHGGDGTQFAIRVLGPTARTRIQQYDERQHAWVDAR